MRERHGFKNGAQRFIRGTSIMNVALCATVMVAEGAVNWHRVASVNLSYRRAGDKINFDCLFPPLGKYNQRYPNAPPSNETVHRAANCELCGVVESVSNEECKMQAKPTGYGLLRVRTVFRFTRGCISSRSHGWYIHGGSQRGHTGRYLVYIWATLS